MDIIRVLRILEYIGPRDIVETQVSKSIHVEKTFGPRQQGVVRAVTLGAYPEILDSGGLEAQLVSYRERIAELESSLHSKERDLEDCREELLFLDGQVPEHD